MNYVFGQWGPTYFVELGVARSEIGAWLALPGTVSVWGAFLIGWLEGRAIRGGMSQLRLRRVFTQVCASQPQPSILGCVDCCALNSRHMCTSQPNPCWIDLPSL